MPYQFLILTILFIQIQICSCSEQLYLTASEMKDLVNFEQELANEFLEIYKKETKRLDGIEKKLNYIEKIGKKEIEIATSHPTDSYQLLTRFQNDWNELEWLYTPKSTKEDIKHLTYFTDKITSFDKGDELRGTIHTMLRLQETYKISVDEMAKGLPPPTQKLTNGDLFEIAMYANHFYNYPKARDWSKYLIGQNPSDVDIPMGRWNLSDVYELLAWSEYKNRNYVEAIEATKMSIRLKPTEKQKYNLLWYQTLITHGDGEKDPAPEVIKYEFGLQYNKTQQAIICRREKPLDPAIAATLFCMNYAPHPQFYLKPLKQEQLFHDPKIVKYHEILSESEIRHVKTKARSKLKTAEVYRMDNGKLATARHRISKSAWLHSLGDEVVTRIMNRVGALGNFDMTFSEPLQVANYGIGGNYEAHFDYAPPPHNSSIFGVYDFGNRIATMLFYLETVERGGDTAFVDLTPGVSATAVKGSGIFWHNLKRNGEGNPATRHAACPVLLGEKWVSNLWIHENGQEFRHPCTLNPNE